MSLIRRYWFQTSVAGLLAIIALNLFQVSRASRAPSSDGRDVTQVQSEPQGNHDSNGGQIRDDASLAPESHMRGGCMMRGGMNSRDPKCGMIGKREP